MTESQLFSLEESLKALKALQALRAAAGLGPQQFPIQAFVGMISDEIEALRDQGKSDDEIASLIEHSSAIKITAEQIGENFAAAEQRHQHGS